VVMPNICLLRIGFSLTRIRLVALTLRSVGDRDRYCPNSKELGIVHPLGW